MRILVLILCFLWAGYTEADSRIGAIELRGDGQIDDRRLRRSISTLIGTPWSDQTEREIKHRLSQTLRDEGYQDGEVTVSERTHSDGAPVRVRIEVIPGPVITIQKVLLPESLPASLSALLMREAERSYGERASRVMLNRLTKNLRYRLRAEGYLQGAVRIQGAVMNGSGVELTYTIVPRTPVQFVFSGNREFSAEELLSPLDLENRPVPFTEGAVQSLFAGIRRMYQSKGYFYADVEATRDEENGRTRYAVQISEGKRYVFTGYTIETKLNQEELLKIVQSDEPNSLRSIIFPARVLETERVAAALSRLKSFLEGQGYLNGAVHFEIIQTAEELSVLIQVHEGPQTLMPLPIILSEELPGPALLEGLKNSELEGKPWSDELIRGEQRRLQNLLGENGYLEAQVRVQSNPERKILEYRVTPGKQSRVGELIYRGNIDTSEEFLKSQSILHRGDILSEERLLEQRRKLYRTGLFRSVSTELSSVEDLRSDGERRLTIDLQERDTGRMGGGVAFNTEDGLRLTGELGQENLFGRGESFTGAADLFFRTGEQILDAGRARIEYRRPGFLDENSLFFSEAFFQYDVEIVSSYSFHRSGVSPYVRHTLSPSLYWDLGLLAYQERLFDLSPDAVISPNDEGSRFFSAIRSALQYDRRDDPFNPRKGYFTSLDTRVFTDLTGSEVQLVTASFQLSGYLSLFRDLVLASGIRGAVVRGISDEVPISQRFFLGGRNSIRGFNRNQVAPRGINGAVAGGDTSVVWNTELQLDLAESIIGVLFLDAGESYLVEKGAFRGDPRSIERLRYSPGFGLRYRTPIGPLSLEYGFALNRDFGEPPGRFIFGIGNTF